MAINDTAALQFAAENLCESDNLTLFQENCRSRVIFSREIPINLVEPVYGYVVPIFVLIMLVTNASIVAVFSRQHMRTPTNLVLLAMALADLFCGLCVCPWFLYFYTFGGHEFEKTEGLPAFWCTTMIFFTKHLPRIFHTIAIWLTLFLAAQRYVQICILKFHQSNLVTRTKEIIFGIFVGSVFLALPGIFSSNFVSYETSSALNQQKRVCVFKLADWVRKLDQKVYTSMMTSMDAVLLRIVPCLLLVYFTGVLISHLREAKNRRIVLKPTISLENSVCRRQRRDTEVSVGVYDSTTRMLVAVILLFLVVEMAAAILFVTHILIVSGVLPKSTYAAINTASVLRNAFMFVTNPFKFVIYCAMSAQFRETFLQQCSSESSVRRRVKNAVSLTV